MKIKKIRVERYGPLENIDLSIEAQLQPIYGLNESGKTLLLDFLVKKLVGKYALKEKDLNRVTEQPEGFITIQDERRKEIKLEKEETLANYLGVTPQQIRNIFLIRNTDLKIPNEHKLYEGVTDKLTGLSSEATRKISSCLLEIGRITSENKELSNAKEHKKVKQKVKEAKRLKEKIDEYYKTSEEKEFAELEKKIRRIEQTISNKKQQLKQLKKAKEKEEYENMREKVTEYEKTVSLIQEMPPAEELEGLLRNTQDLIEKKENKTKYERLSTASFWAALTTLIIVGVLWTIWAVLTPPIIGIATPILLLLFLTICCAVWISSGNTLLTLEREIAKINEKASLFELNCDSLKELSSQLESMIGKRGDAIKLIRENLGILRNWLNLSSNNKVDDNLIISKAKKKLEKLEKEIDINLEVKYEKHVYENLEEELEKLGEELNKLNMNLKEHVLTLAEFERNSQKLDFQFFLGRELELEIRNLESLKRLSEELNEYITEIEMNANDCRIAIEIFDEIEREEKEKVTELFNEKSMVSEIFSKLTDNRYTNVRYDQNEEKIIVRKASGEELSAEKLSKGTFDQLYFAIRVDLAHQLLGKKKAFFILDDTFLASDDERFKEGAKVLSELSEKGWQLIYFTTKKRESNELSKIANTKPLRLKRLP